MGDWGEVGKKLALPDLGTAEGISAFPRLNTEKMQEVLGGMVGPEVGNISQLAKSPLAPQEVKGILEYLKNIMPKRAGLVRNSEFVADGLSNPKAVGQYSAAVDSAKIGLNNTKGVPRSPKEVMTTIFHEIFGHGNDAEKGIAKLGGGEEGLANYLDKIDNERIQYSAHSTRPSEIKAKRIADYLTNGLVKKGKL